MAVQKFIIGEAVIIRTAYRDPFTKTLMDPASSNITIKNKSGVVVVDDVIMDKVAGEDGTFQYIFTSEDDAELGTYVAIMSGNFNGNIVKDKRHFVIEGEN